MMKCGVFALSLFFVFGGCLAKSKKGADSLVLDAKDAKNYLKHYHTGLNIGKLPSLTLDTKEAFCDLKFPGHRISSAFYPSLQHECCEENRLCTVEEMKEYDEGQTVDQAKASRDVYVNFCCTENTENNDKATDQKTKKASQ